jgi:hypothetical protein
LEEHIKDVARRFAGEGFVAIAHRARSVLRRNCHRTRRSPETADGPGLGSGVSRDSGGYRRAAWTR